MAILLNVKWVDKSDQPEPHQRIRHIGGNSCELQWKHSHSQAIEFIERDFFCYYVENNLRPSKLKVAQTANGNKYLIAEPEHLLLDLPPFS